MENIISTKRRPPTPPDGIGGKATQAGQNQILSERLATRAQQGRNKQATTDRKKPFDAQEQALKCRELVAGDKKYPAKLLDVLDTLPALIALKHTGGQTAGSVPPHRRYLRSKVQTLRPHRS